MSMPKLDPTDSIHIENQLKPTYNALINSLQAEVKFYQASKFIIKSCTRYNNQQFHRKNTKLYDAISLT